MSGASVSNIAIAEVNQLVKGLMEQSPAKVLELFPPRAEGGPSGPMYSNFGTLAATWATQDLVAYTNWVNQQSDPIIRDQAAAVVVGQLTRQHQFAEAAEWAMSSEAMQDRLMSVVGSWSQSNPSEASVWLESAALPDTKKENIRNVIKAYESEP